jgi:hypothetical protein
MEPDLTVVVGGVEFYHYKSMLCDICPLIDTMLSVKMKESNESRVEFPDKNPDNWLLVYKMLDHAVSETEKDGIFSALFETNEIRLSPLRREMVGSSVPYDLLSWFNYLGMESLVELYDKKAARLLQKNNILTPARYQNWCIYKHLPCPLLHAAFKKKCKYNIDMILLCLEERCKATFAGYAKFVDDFVKPILLDCSECGDEMWQYLDSKIFIPPSLLAEHDRKTIVESPFFGYLLTSFILR